MTQTRNLKFILVITLFILQSTPLKGTEDVGLEVIPDDCKLSHWVLTLEKMFIGFGEQLFTFVNHSEYDLYPAIFSTIDNIKCDSTRIVIKKTLEWSPESTYCATMFVHSLYLHSGGWVAFQDSPDSYIHIFNADSLKGWQVASAGPSMAYHALGWLSDSTLLILGKSKYFLENRTTENRLFALKIQINSKTISKWFFRGPALNDAQTKQLWIEWNHWLKSQYNHVEWKKNF